ncbi:MAG: response regulator [Candidatus Acidiferrum sp.]
MTQEVFESNGFEVVPVGSVNDALKQIIAQKFDVLVTDLHMPSPGDGYAVVTAMRHAQPHALTIVVSGYPDIDGAMAAIALQADQVLAKPVEFANLCELIRTRVGNLDRASHPSQRRSVGTILERDISGTVERWTSRVAKNKELTAIPVGVTERSSHIPLMLRNIITRHRKLRDLETEANPSPEAVEHGALRFFQHYTAPLIVQESRLLQVCIFETLQKSLVDVDLSLVLPDVMLIADEVDAQLTQCIDGFLKAQESKLTRLA